MDSLYDNLRKATDNTKDITTEKFGTITELNGDLCSVKEEGVDLEHYNVPIMNGVKLKLGDKVIIGFINNNIYNPVVIGTLSHIDTDISDVTNLQEALNGKSNINHSHNIWDLDQTNHRGINFLSDGTDKEGYGFDIASRLYYNEREDKLYYDKNGSIDYDDGNELATVNDIPSLGNYVQKSQTVGLIKNDGTIDTTDYVNTNDSRLSDSRTPKSHNHGNLQNNGIVKVNGTAQASKNVCTDANGYITTENKNNHTHSQYLTEHQSLENYVQKETGKGLSSNDFTNSEKEKLEGIEENANNYTHPSYTPKSSGLYKVTVDNTGHVSDATAVAKADITALGIPSTNSTYTPASATPLADASAGVVGTSAKYAREDHKHPKSSLYAESSHIHTDYNKATYEQTVASTATGAYEIGKITVDGAVTTLYGKDTNTEYTHPTYSNVAKSTSKLYKIKTNSLGHIIEITEATSTDIANLGVKITDTVYTHPSYTSKASGLYKITVDGTGHISGTASVSASDLPSHSHTVSNISDFPSIPSKTSDLTNDSGFITSHQDISGKEDKSNKTSSWNSSTNNTRYPTEKLVKDSLDTKAEKVHTHKNLAKTTITSGSLDDYTDTGWYSYSQANNANITNIPPLPAACGCMMEVLDDYGDGKYVVQTVYSLPNNKNSLIFYRQKNDTNGWSDWVRIDGKNKISISDTSGLVKNDGTIMTSGTGASNWTVGNDSRLSNARDPSMNTVTPNADTDIDTYYTKTAFYSFFSNANVGNISATNKAKLPKGLGDNSFYLLVERYSNNYVTQRIIRYSDGKTWRRIKNVSNWTAWEEITFANNSFEYIVGTHGTTATATWTGTCSRLTKIQDGTVILFYLTSAGATNVTLDLTLPDGTTTGAKNVYFKGTTRLSTQYPINSIVTLVYTTKKDSGAWYVSSANDNNSYNAYEYGTVQFIAGEALTTRTLCGAKNDGKYYKVASGVVLDTTYPLIFTNGAIASGANSNNMYNPRYDESITNTKSITLTSGKPVYLEGTSYANGLFTVSSDVVTQTLTSGRYYWLIGFAYGASNLRTNVYEKIFYYDGTNKYPIEKPTSHTHGDLTNDGKISTTQVSFADADMPIVADSSASWKLQRGYVPAKYIKDPTAYGNIGTSSNATQASINSNINSKLNTKASISNIFHYELTSSKYTLDIEDSITITVKVTDGAGNPVSNKQVYLLEDEEEIFDYNNSSISSNTTNSNGIATWTIDFGHTLNFPKEKWGLIDYHIQGTDAHIQVLVDGWYYLNGTSSSSWALMRNKNYAKLVMNGWSPSSDVTTSWVQIGSSGMALDALPYTYFEAIGFVNTTIFYIRIKPSGVTGAGNVEIRCGSGTISKTNQFYLDTMWAIKE